ncbi:MAG: hypothetical protein JSU09_16915 [Bacteroidetes bacterium]|jgi:hypothetical protein|nr:hypothetical protein [Bacteroidota bacterium]MCZ8072124.1 hypothetical protein [Cytophagales bacterium]
MDRSLSPFSNTQLELLKLFSTGLSDSELKELRELLANFYANKSIKAADKAWDEKGLSNQEMDRWLNEPSQ